MRDLIVDAMELSAIAPLGTTSPFKVQGAATPANADVDPLPLPEVSLEVVDDGAAEAGADQGVFRLTRTGSPDLELTIAVETSGTADADDTDGFAGLETVTFEAGVASFDLVITPLADRIAEQTETAILTLLAGDEYTLTGTTTGTVTIEDDVSVFGGPDVVAYWPASTFVPAGLDDVIGGTGSGISEDGGEVVTVSGRSGAGLVLDGVADSVSIEHVPAFELIEGSFAIWFNADLTGEVLPILSKGLSGDEDNVDGSLLNLTVEASGALSATIATPMGEARIEGGETTPGQFHHAVITWGGPDGFTLYLDGALIGAAAFTDGIDGNANDILLGLGGDQSSGLDRFDGLLDEAALFSTALTAPEIEALRVQGLLENGLVQPDFEAGPPIPGPDAFEVEQGDRVAFDVLANDESPNGLDLTPLAVNGTIGALGDTVILASGATVTFTQDETGAATLTFDAGSVFDGLARDETATQTFSYTVADAQGLTAETDVIVTVVGANDDPVAQDDEQFTDEETPVIVPVLANDSDIDGEALTIAAVDGVMIGAGETVTLASGARVTREADETLLYDPGPAFQDLGTDITRTDAFTYEVSDGSGGSATALVEVTVVGINDDPVAQDDAAETDEDTAIAVAVLDNDSDVDTDVLKIDAVDGQTVALGDTIMLESGAQVTLTEAGVLTYDPLEVFQSLGDGQTSTDSYSYLVTDGDAGSATATVAVTINGINDDPIAAADLFETNEDMGLFLNVLANDSDVEGDPLAVTAVDGHTLIVGQAVELASGATVTLTPDGTLLYDPDEAFQALTDGQSGTQAFTYTLSDGQGGSADGEVTITVDGRNDPPVAVDDRAETSESMAVTFNVLDNDSDVEGQAIRLIQINGETARTGDVITLASGALLTVDRDGTLVYDPNGAFDDLFDRLTEDDVFSYTLRDSEGAIATGIVTVEITGEGELPFDFTAYYPTTDTVLPALFDESGNRFDGTLSGGVAVAPGAVDDGLAFDGEDGFVRIPTVPEFQSDAGAISLWFNTDTFGETQALFSADAFGLGDGHLTVSLTPDLAVQARIQGPQGSFLIESGPVSLNEFHHVVVNFGEETGFELYVDGERAGRRPNIAQNLTGNMNDITLGASQIISGEGDTENLIQFFSGTIDEVSIHPEALTAGEVDILGRFVERGIEVLGQENREPLAVDDDVRVFRDETVTFDVLANDTDGNGDDLTVILLRGQEITGPGFTIETVNGGLVTFEGDGVLTYDPNGQFDDLAIGEVAQDAFNYRIEDEGGLRDTGRVFVTIEGTPDFDLAAYWPGDAGDGTVLEDLSGNDIDGGLFNGASFQPGLVGDAIRLDGFDDVAVIEHDDALLIDEGTVSIWVKADRLGSDQGIFSKDAAFNGTGGHFDLRILADGSVVYRIQGEDADDEAELTGGQVSVGEWTHIVATFGDDGAQLYQDGNLIGSDVDFTSGLGTSSGGAGNFEAITLGATQRFSQDLSTDPLAQFLQGQIDEAAVLREQADAALVQALFEAGLAGVALADGDVAGAAVLTDDDSFDLFG